MTAVSIVEALRRLVEGEDLTRDEAAAGMEAIMSGAATDSIGSRPSHVSRV